MVRHLVFMKPLILEEKLDESFHNELIQLLLHKCLRGRGGGGNEWIWLRRSLENPVFKKVLPISKPK